MPPEKKYRLTLRGRLLRRLVGRKARSPETVAVEAARRTRFYAEFYAGADPRDFEGTYGEYLLAKVAKVFPGLGGQVLDLPDGPVGPTR